MVTQQHVLLTSDILLQWTEFISDPFDLFSLLLVHSSIHSCMQNFHIPFQFFKAHSKLKKLNQLKRQHKITYSFIKSHPELHVTISCKFFSCYSLTTFDRFFQQFSNLFLNCDFTLLLCILQFDMKNYLERCEQFKKMENYSLPFVMQELPILIRYLVANFFLDYSIVSSVALMEPIRYVATCILECNKLLFTPVSVEIIRQTIATNSQTILQQIEYIFLASKFLPTNYAGNTLWNQFPLTSILIHQPPNNIPKEFFKNWKIILYWLQYNPMLNFVTDVLEIIKICPDYLNEKIVAQWVSSNEMMYRILLDDPEFSTLLQQSIEISIAACKTNDAYFLCIPEAHRNDRRVCKAVVQHSFYIISVFPPFPTIFQVDQLLRYEAICNGYTTLLKENSEKNLWELALYNTPQLLSKYQQFLLQYQTEEEKQHCIHLIRIALRTDMSVFAQLSEEWRSNKQVIINAIKLNNFQFMKHVPVHLLQQEEFVLELLQYNQEDIFLFLDDSFKANETIMKRAVAKYPSAIRFASTTLLQSPSFVKFLKTQVPEALKILATLNTNNTHSTTTKKCILC